MSLLSFIIPAYNEEAVIGDALAAIFDSAREIGVPFEVIVVDDGSTDRTGEIAAAAGARVVRIERRQIAAARNAGAREARGDVLVFVDADTLVRPAVLRAMLAALEQGAVGGGAGIDFDDMPRSTAAAIRVFMVVYQALRLAAGCFLFARRDAFEAAGGWDERYFASEEVHLSWALRKQGRFVILRERVVSSARKARMYTPLQLLWRTIVLVLRGPAGARRREGLEMWYDGRREESSGRLLREASERASGSPTLREASRSE